MKIQLIRNATMKIKYAGKTFLTDPMLSPKGSIRSFAGIEENPTIELPLSIEEILQGIDAVLVSHNHPDHFDAVAVKDLAKDSLIFCQPGEKEIREKEGFTNVTEITDHIKWNDIEIIRTGGKHGSGEILEMMGHVSGFVLKAKNEPTVYWIGDSILNEEIKSVIETHKPDYVITHSGGAVIPGFAPIIMDAESTIKIVNDFPATKVVAVHMESLDHCPVSRDLLKETAVKNLAGLDRLIIPLDGEILDI